MRTSLFSALDTAILVCFIVEAGCKFVSEGLYPYRYWVGPDWKWNMFDFGIIIMSFDFAKKSVGANAQVCNRILTAVLT